MTTQAREGRGGLMASVPDWAYWPGGFEQWRRDREELEREDGPELYGCEPPPPAPLPEAPCPIDVSAFRSNPAPDGGDAPRSRGDELLARIDHACDLRERAYERLPRIKHNLCGGTGMRPLGGSGSGWPSERCGCYGGQTYCGECAERAAREVRALLTDGRFDDDAVVRRAAMCRCSTHAGAPSPAPERAQ